MFAIRALNHGCHAIDANGKTVAFVTPQGYVDWLAQSPQELGSSRLTEIDKETHLGNVRGLKFNLHLPHCCEQMTCLRMDIAPDGGRAVVIGKSVSTDGRLCGECRAELGVDAATGLYFWMLETQLACATDTSMALPVVEYNNILPARTGGRFLWARRKAFDRTLVVDRDGIAWEFPHQHLLHYGDKLDAVRCGVGGLAGFFGEELNPVVTVETSAGEPPWQICEAYYDLHCMSKHAKPLTPGEDWRWRYRLHWLDAAAAKPLLCAARRTTVTPEDWKRCGGARLELGLNDFRHPVRLDGVDEAAAFIPEPPTRRWDRQGGPDGTGALLLASDKDGELVWHAMDSQIPPGGCLRVRGLMRMSGHGGRGMFFRVRPLVFHWRPEPHVEWLPVVASEPLRDTGGQWVEFTVPELARPPRERDTELRFEVVLDGPGVGALACLNIDLE